MPDYAQDFYEIPEVVEENSELRERILQLVEQEPIPGKVTEGGDRMETLRNLLSEFFRGEILLEELEQQISTDIPRHESEHRQNNRVFPEGWEERLARTQISRFYNQAVLLTLREQGEERCFVPHSDNEDRDSPCTIHLAGEDADIDTLLDRLNRSYREGEWHDEVKIPDHPHCTHTVVPNQT
ncbi:hypothetical protein [Haloarcula marismortui]|uniref:Uncharacterized protein n=2 Tax=Haloarcula marismortui TaxID=2238 RepID=M0JQK7_9EURY|nr:hypothetical protein [Haloarcula sinaiiensis]EMA10269.1 hypothetical protein C436_18051 [Haloarcula sinaiiensis ATCC 33800]QUJ74912.1 hypothetical protein KDQ40_22580 [Haloarcula sinaiiensis ATCC 33800]